MRHLKDLIRNTNNNKKSLIQNKKLTFGKRETDITSVITMSTGKIPERRIAITDSKVIIVITLITTITDKNLGKPIEMRRDRYNQHDL